MENYGKTVFKDVQILDKQKLYGTLKDEDWASLLKSIQKTLGEDDYMFAGDDNLVEVYEHLKNVTVVNCIKFCCIIIRRSKNFDKMSRGNARSSIVVRKIQKAMKVYDAKKPKKAGFRPDSIAICLAPIMMACKTFYNKENFGDFNGILPMCYRWIGSVAAIPMASPQNSKKALEDYDAYLQFYVTQRTRKDGKGKTDEEKAEARERTRTAYRRQVNRLSEECKDAWATQLFYPPTFYDVAREMSESQYAALNLNFA